MQLIDVQSGEEINLGQEMKAVMTFITGVNKLKEIHEQLSTFYCALYNNSSLLERNNSERLKKLGHELVLTKDIQKSIEEFREFEDSIIERAILTNLKKLGYSKKHWYFKEYFLLEIEYMLDTLSILIEPDFMPIASIDDSSQAAEIDRYISPEVKINVWRRDQGKCVECGSKEKLEYDHVIPISKGGSNTERNVQLLCQSCNRKKSAAIQ